MTWGTQRIEYGSCTRPQCTWLVTISLPSSRPRSAPATAIWPIWPRAAWMRASNGLTEPWIASSDSAPAISPAASTCSAPNSPASVSAVETCVPFSSARPSLGPSTKGARPMRCIAAAPEMTAPSGVVTSPSPISTQARCASGARSPEAPTEPLAGMRGTRPALNSASKASTRAGRTPEWPRARLTALVASTSRTTPSASGAPTPTLCESTRLRCSSARRLGGMMVCASLPKPVLMP